ncbi:uncharacterized protein LOC114882301 [Osmia bicornis bicornis]|uniref:uncharacterized protein LOC114882301 n=1 Tax=Osmia bicornis bicornis TaxID=1437191 RepID=UPI001EAE8A5D|nr:uncharacterized protein LOC114882301 [Osmia bicornis bicornis]
MNVSQSTVSRIVFRVSLLIGSLMTEYIKFPRDPDNSTQNCRLFNNLGQGNGAIGLPGCRGSSYGIFRTSRLHMGYVTGELDGIFVGEGGYPYLPFLMTPLRNPQTEEEIRYNEIQIRTRQIVERTFGLWHSCRRR